MGSSMPDASQTVDRPAAVDDDRQVVQIRLTGTPAQCDRVVQVLRRSLDLDHVSEPVPGQPGLVSVFVDAYARRAPRAGR